MKLDMILNLGITIKIFLLMLLVADTQLCKRLCPSGSVKMLIYDAAVMFACVCEHGVGEGMDGGCMPLPIRMQRYCEPESLFLS